MRGEEAVLKSVTGEEDDVWMAVGGVRGGR